MSPHGVDFVLRHDTAVRACVSGEVRRNLLDPDGEWRRGAGAAQFLLKRLNDRLGHGDAALFRKAQGYGHRPNG
jgi:hypothetical protein